MAAAHPTRQDSSSALVFGGYRAWKSTVALPLPHGPQAFTCVWVKNNQLASAKQIYNAAVRIEYLYDGSPEFVIPNACWWHEPAGKSPISWPPRIDLTPNESQCFPVFMQPVGATKLDPPWPQSAMEEDTSTHGLRPGRWTLLVTVTADSAEPLIGKLEFTVYQQEERERLSVGCQPPMGDVWLPFEPEPTAQQPTNPAPAQESTPRRPALAAFWHWVGTRWAWATLATGGGALIKFGEFAVGWFLLVLSCFTVSSKITHWKKAHPPGEPLIKALGYLMVAGGLGFATLVMFRIKGNDPWSHLPAAWSGPSHPQKEAPTATAAPASPKTSTEPTLTNETSLPTESPIDGLTRLGWLVMADPANGTRVQFQDRSKSLPDMHKSAHHIGLLHGPISVGIIEAQSLQGLSALSSIKSIQTLTLAGNFSDLAELRAMKFIQRLDLVGMSVSDLESIGSLRQLRELTLEQRPNGSLDIGPLKTLVNLQKLTIVQFPIQGLAPLRDMASLAVLNLTGSMVADLSPLLDLHSLTELTIDQRMAPALAQLHSTHLKLLHIMHTDGISDPIDLTPVPNLEGLETLDITAAGIVTLAPLRGLSTSLSRLTITGTAISFRDVNYIVHLQGLNVIGTLHNLTFLGLAWIDVSNTDFLSGLNRLEEIYINQTRSLTDIRTLGTLESVRSVQLAGTSVVDISPLLNLGHLKMLTLQATPARFNVITELKRQGVIIK